MDVAPEQFPDVDFSFIKPRGTKDEEEEDIQGDAMVDEGTTGGDQEEMIKGTVEVLIDTPGEPGLEDTVMGDVNPEK